MRIGSRLGQTALRPAAAAFMLLAASALSAAVQLDWERAESKDQRFSVETLCSAEDVAEYSANTRNLDRFKASPESHVYCRADDMGMFAVMTDLPTKPGEKTAFDLIADRAVKRPNEPGMQMIKLGDRRAVINRETRGGDMAQTTVVDLGHQGVIIMNIGLLEGSPLSDAEKAEVIDRFTNSLKVTAK